jgi:hypothetical protein
MTAVLSKGASAGRGAERGAKVIRGWRWEDGVERSEEVCAALTACLDRFLDYLGVKRLSIERRVVEEAGLDWLAGAADATVAPGAS